MTRSNGFDRLAPYYDLMLKLTSGNAILNSQTALLPGLPALGKILIIGGGTGTFLLKLLKQQPNASIVYLDNSAGMMKETQKKVQRQMPEALPRITFICDNLSRLDAAQSFDAVFTHYFLDQFKPEELKTIMPDIHAHVAPGGYWCVTDFNDIDPKSKSIKTAIYRGVHRLLYSFFRSLCNISANKIPDLRNELEILGMAKITERYFLQKLLWCGIYRK